MRKIILLFIAIPFFFNLSLADPCDQHLIENADSNQEIAYRRFSNRCEGFYGAKVSNNVFRVVGLTVGKLTFAMHREEVLSVALAHYPNETINIQAMSIPVRTYYRMDARIEPGETLSWPVKDIILKRPEELTADKIGLLAYLNDDKGKIYFPVKAQSIQKSADRETSINLIVSPLKDLGSFKWRINKGSGKEKTTEKKWDDPVEHSNKFPTGHPITIQISPQNTGILYLELTARVKDHREWVTEYIRLNVG
jgi:hypothetical protein